MGSNHNHNAANYSDKCIHSKMALASIVLITMLLGGYYNGDLVESANSNGMCPFTAIFNFGDSNSDTGGFVAAFPSLSRPNGETTFNEPAGRFSDGRLIIDFIGKSY
mgnify:CR=1 FL=1